MTVEHHIPVERPWPLVSVIVPVKDGLDLLVRCVHALLAQDYPADRYEVLVVDNGSKVSPVTVLPADPRLTVLFEPSPGSYTARNRALQIARGEILAFTDADCDPQADWISAAARFLVEHPDVAMIGGRVDLRFAGGRPQNGPEWFEFVNGFPQEEYLAKGYAVTANMVTRRQVFDRVGDFDSRLLSGGDGEWGRRVRAAGLAQAYVPSAAIEHPARDSWTELRIKTQRTTRGVVRRAAGQPGVRGKIVRMILGQVRRTVVAPIAVFRQPVLPTWRARFLFLMTRWRVDLTVLTILVGALANPQKV